MDYKEYQKSRNAAWEILIDQHIDKLPVPIIKICRSLNVYVKYESDLSGGENSGYTMIINNHPYIILDPDMSSERKRFTAAHELGHIILGHVGRYQLVARDPDPKDNPVEQAANIFASRLLAPACVLWGCRVKSPGEIARLCRISLTAAEYRYERYQQLLRRNKFLSSELERQVYQQFTNFIRGHQQWGDY